MFLGLHIPGVSARQWDILAGFHPGSDLPIHCHMWPALDSEFSPLSHQMEMLLGKRMQFVTMDVLML